MIRTYGPIREKINQAVRQFKEYKAFPCSVVLANPESVFVHLGDPWAIIGVMLGNAGFRVQLDANPDESPMIEQVFTSGGKLVNDIRKEPQNTTVSSIIVLATYPLRDKRIRIAIRERQLQLGRRTTLQENLEFYDAVPDSPDLRRVRVIVYENLYARFHSVEICFAARSMKDGVSMESSFSGYSSGVRSPSSKQHSGWKTENTG